MAPHCTSPDGHCSLTPRTRSQCHANSARWPQAPPTHSRRRPLRCLSASRRTEGCAKRTSPPCAPHIGPLHRSLGWFSIARFVFRSQATGADLVDDAYWTATCGALGANPGNQLNCVESLATVRMMGACADEGLTEGHLRQLYCGEGAWAEGREADYRAVFGSPAKEHVSDICT